MGEAAQHRQAVRTGLAALLAVCCLLACRSHEAALPPSINILNENIRLLHNIMKTKVSCDKMNVTNVFAEHKAGAEQGVPPAAPPGLSLSSKEAELLCKAAAVAAEGQSCHRQLRGVAINLHELLRRASAAPRLPCPVAAGNTTSLKRFLQDLNRVHQRLVKNSQI